MLGSGKIKVFHGSNKVVGSHENPVRVDHAEANSDTDFGKGFYLASYYGQAVKWAKQITAKKSGIETVNEFIFDMKKAQSMFRCKIENEYNASWLELIEQCRDGKGETLTAGYDIIAGRLADGQRMDRILEEYRQKKQILKNDPEALNAAIAETVEKLKFENNDWYQICIKTQNAADALLTFTGNAKEKANKDRAKREAKKKAKRIAQSLADKQKKGK